MDEGKPTLIFSNESLQSSLRLAEAARRSVDVVLERFEHAA